MFVVTVGTAGLRNFLLCYFLITLNFFNRYQFFNAFVNVLTLRPCLFHWNKFIFRETVISVLEKYPQLLKVRPDLSYFFGITEERFLRKFNDMTSNVCSHGSTKCRAIEMHILYIPLFRPFWNPLKDDNIKKKLWKR